MLAGLHYRPNSGAKNASGMTVTDGVDAEPEGEGPPSPLGDESDPAASDGDGSECDEDESDPDEGPESVEDGPDPD